MSKLTTTMLGIAIWSIVAVPIASADVFGRDLFFGLTTDSEVTRLQEFLSDQNLYTGPITGNFYSLTVTAVSRFQRDNAITPASGYFGPKTRALANVILGRSLASGEGSEVLIQTGSSTAEIQLAALFKQIALLQAQLKAQQQIASTTRVLNDQVATQGQMLQRIQQNTQPLSPPPPTSTPTPTPSPAPAIPPLPIPPTATPPQRSAVPFNTLTNITIRRGADWAEVSLGNTSLVKDIALAIDNHVYNLNTATTNVMRIEGLDSGRLYPFTVEARTVDKIATSSGSFYTVSRQSPLSCTPNRNAGSPSQYLQIRCQSQYASKAVTVEALVVVLGGYDAAGATLDAYLPSGEKVFTTTIPPGSAPPGTGLKSVTIDLPTPITVQSDVALLEVRTTGGWASGDAARVVVDGTEFITYGGFE